MSSFSPNDVPVAQPPKVGSSFSPFDVPVPAAPETPGLMAGMLGSYGEGATGNFSDEASGALGATAAKVRSWVDSAKALAGLHAGPGVDLTDVGRETNPERTAAAIQPASADDFANVYRRVRDFARQQHESFANEHPALDFLGQTVGGGAALALGGEALKGAGAVETAAEAAKPFLQTVPKLAGTGAAFGGVYGAGASNKEDLPGWLQDAGEGAVGGAILGVAIPPAARGVMNMVRLPISKLSAALSQTGNVDRTANAQLLRALTDDGWTIQSAMAKVGEMGPEASLMDLNTPSIRGLAEGVASQPGKGAATIEARARRLQQGQVMRITDAIKAAFTPGDERDFMQVFDAFNNEVKQHASPMYAIAQEIPIKPTRALNSIMQENTMSGVMQKAFNMAQQEGVTLPDRVRILSDGSRVPVKNPPTFNEIDYAKRVLDGMIAKKENPGVGKMPDKAAVRSLATLRDRFLAAAEASMQDNGAAYKQARLAASDPLANRAALLRGVKFLNEPEYQIQRFMNDPNTSDTEKYAIKVGVMKAMVDKARSTPDAADAAKRMFGNDMIRGKLRLILQDDQSYDQLKRAMVNEGEMFKTTYDALGNSVTARRQAAQKAINAPPPNLFKRGMSAIRAVHDPAGFAMDQAAELAQPRSPIEATRNALVPRLLGNNPVQQLQQIGAAQPILPPLTNSVDPRIAALVAAMSPNAWPTR